MSYLLLLNIVSIKNQEASKELNKVFNPKKMYISRNDGLFNNEFNLVKDEIIGLYQWNNC